MKLIKAFSKKTPREIETAKSWKLITWDQMKSYIISQISLPEDEIVTGVVADDAGIYVTTGPKEKPLR